MKKIKRRIFNSLSLICLVCVFLLITLIVKKSNIPMDNFMLFGDKINNNEHVSIFMDKTDHSIIKTSNDSFSTDGMTSHLLLKMIQENASKKINGKMVPISNIIQRSNYITIALGNHDFTDRIKVNNDLKELKYDLEVLKRQIEVTSLNVFNIIDEIQIINNRAVILLLGTFCPFYDVSLLQYDEMHQLFYSMNESLIDIAKETNIKFVDLSLLENPEYYTKNTYTINENAMTYIGEKMYSCAIENHC